MLSVVVDVDEDYVDFGVTNIQGYEVLVIVVLSI
jgi:hypothetical protein